MKDPQRLIDHVLQKVALEDIMVEYGVKFTFNPRHVDEAQFSCPFHGQDNKPSARLYKQTQSCFCWVCRKRWNAITFVRDKENMSFMEAVKYLIKRYRIDISSIPDRPELLKKETRRVSGFDIELKFVKGKIRGLRGRVPFEKYRALVGVYNMILFGVHNKQDMKGALSKLGDKTFMLEGAIHG